MLRSFVLEARSAEWIGVPVPARPGAESPRNVAEARGGGKDGAGLRCAAGMAGARGRAGRPLARGFAGDTIVCRWENLGRALRVSFTLPGPAPARLELFNVAGRAVRIRDVGDLGAGHHEVDLGRGEALPVGLYVVRLTQAGRPLSLKVVVLE